MFKNTRSTRKAAGVFAFASLLFDELTQVNPINRNFVFSLTPDNFSIVYKIKNYSEVARRFA